MAKKAKRFERTLSNEDRRKYDGIRRQLDGERNEILAEARRRKRVHDALTAERRLRANLGRPVEKLNVSVRPDFPVSSVRKYSAQTLVRSGTVAGAHEIRPYGLAAAWGFSYPLNMLRKGSVGASLAEGRCPQSVFPRHRLHAPDVRPE